MTTTDGQYVPSEDDLRHAYRTTRLLDHHADVNAAFDRFLARVRRDAKAEALREAAGRARHDLGWESGGHTSTYSVRHWLGRLATECETGDPT